MDGSQSTQPADIRRKRFTAADVQAMLDAGILREGEKVELIGGELVEMSPQRPLHSGIGHVIEKWFRRNLPGAFDFGAQRPLRLGSEDEPEPEIFVFADGLEVNSVQGRDVVLAIEVAHSGLSYDLGYKAKVYASHGIREYWVVDVENRQTLVHHLRADATYGEPTPVPFAAPLTAPGGGQLIIVDLAPKA